MVCSLKPDHCNSRHVHVMLRMLTRAPGLMSQESGGTVHTRLWLAQNLGPTGSSRLPPSGSRCQGIDQRTLPRPCRTGRYQVAVPPGDPAAFPAKRGNSAWHTAEDGEMSCCPPVAEKNSGLYLFCSIIRQLEYRVPMLAMNDCRNQSPRYETSLNLRGRKKMRTLVPSLR